MTELTQRLLGTAGDVQVNDLVWALCPEPEEHWDEGRVIQLPKVLPDPSAKPPALSPPPVQMDAAADAGVAEPAPEAGVAEAATGTAVAASGTSTPCRSSIV